MNYILKKDKEIYGIMHEKGTVFTDESPNTIEYDVLQLLCTWRGSYYPLKIGKDIEEA